MDDRKHVHKKRQCGCVALLVMQKSVHLCGFTMNNENAGFHYECKNRYIAKPQR